MTMRQWQAKLQRWHTLGRYYANKWQYDGTKWAERVWHGQGTGNPQAVASVPFMITHTMRQELVAAGFPHQEISGLLPAVAHALIAEKISYAQFRERQQVTAAPVASDDEHMVDSQTFTGTSASTAVTMVVPTEDPSPNESSTTTTVAVTVAVVAAEPSTKESV